MALQISFTDKSGVINAEAYAVINEIQLLPLQKVCYFQAQMWHNSTARSKSDDDQRKTPVFFIRYQINGDDFDTYITDVVIKQNDKSLISQLYAWLKQHEDLETPPSDNRENHGHNIDWTQAVDI